MRTINLPAVVCHSDWGTDARKRWFSMAVQTGESYEGHGPAPVGDHLGFLDRVQREAGKDGTAVFGFDFPIGLPARYAALIGVTQFRSFLLKLGDGEFPDFYRVSENASDVSRYRPFYPQRPGRRRHDHLVTALGLDSMNDLRRVCEQAYPGRNAACPLFWTLGPNQVGKAAINGWRDVLVPALRDPMAMLWPFDGSLEVLLKPGYTVIVETYPAECYGWFFREHLPIRKTRLEARQRVAPTLLRWAASANVTLKPELLRAIEGGFPEGDDAFDAVIGLFGMLEVLMRRRSPGEPVDNDRQVEGWIFGQACPR
jgi:hypothetical protein